MGGNAFTALLQSAAFPRLPPTVYQALKARVQHIMADLYAHVGVPREAPQKTDYGDLDLIVYLPRRHTIPIQSSPESKTSQNVSPDTKTQIYVPHEIVAAMIKAKHVIPLEGNRTSNFAVPISEREWAEYGQIEAEAEIKARKDAGSEGLFYQVDVTVCESKEEWDRRIFHHGYGDLNMIMGLVAKNAGLQYSEKGLKYPDPPNPPILLSDSPDEIVEFFGWSMDEWKAGFETNLACYKWALCTKYFDPSPFKSRGEGIKKRKSDRPMYTGFIEWASSVTRGIPAVVLPGEIPDAREAALDFFKRRSEFNMRRTAQRHKEAFKIFSGTNVRDWTNLGNYWPGVKKIMDGVREELGGDDNIAKLLVDEGEEVLKCIVLGVQSKLAVWPRATTESEEARGDGYEKLARGRTEEG